MVRIFCIASLALAAVSAVSGHVIRHRRGPPPGWETEILQDYKVYHTRYLEFQCQDQHNTTFFDKCCHPLLKGESMDVLTKQGCHAPVDDCSKSSVSPSSTSQPTPSPEVSPSSSPAPAKEKIQKSNPAPSSAPAPTEPASTTSTTSTKEASSAPPAQTPSSDNEFTGGQATFYTQNNVAGACGKVHSDGDFICAMHTDRYGYTGKQSELCGKQVQITNTQNGKMVTVTIADACPTCKGRNSIDLSTAAFKSIADSRLGVVPIRWHFL